MWRTRLFREPSRKASAVGLSTLALGLVLLSAGCENDSDPQQNQNAQQNPWIPGIPGMPPGPAGNQPGLVGNEQGNPNPGQGMPNDPNTPAYSGPQSETVLPAENQKPGTPLRSRKEDTYYQLSNVQLKGDRFGRPTLYVDYEAMRGGQYNGVTMIIRGEGNYEQEVMIIGGLDNRGTIDYTPRFGGPFRPQLPNNLEVYFVRSDNRWGPGKGGTFKVSNSATLGNYTNLTLARNWTQDEITRFTSTPPNHTNPNAHNGIGSDTPLVGDQSGGVQMRYVEPDGHLLGLEFRTGNWENTPCLGGLVAVFKRDQESIHQRVMAKDGYAVGGANVQVNKFVTAIQLIYFRVNPNGSLDPNDSYTSSWFGHPDQSTQPEKLAGDGRKVIGIVLKQGAILNAFGLVTDGP